MNHPIPLFTAHHPWMKWWGAGSRKCLTLKRQRSNRPCQGPPLPSPAPQGTLSQAVSLLTTYLCLCPPTSKMKSYPLGNTCQAVWGSVYPLLQPQFALLPAMPATHLPLNDPSTPHGQASFPGLLSLKPSQGSCLFLQAGFLGLPEGADPCSLGLLTPGADPLSLGSLCVQ